MAAVEATLANFPQSRTAAPDLAPRRPAHRAAAPAAAAAGDPGPSRTRGWRKKGLGRDGAMGIADDELMSQQGENLLRGLARINEDFVFLVTAAFVDRPALTAAMLKMAQVASQVASRQRGSIGAGFSIAVPLAAALTMAKMTASLMTSPGPDGRTPRHRPAPA